MTRPRRDPRGERAASAVVGGARPRFVTHGAAGRPRRDPRAEVAAQHVASPQRLRLDRTLRAASKPATPVVRHPPETPAPRILVMDAPAFLVAVVPDAPAGRLTAHDRQLFGAARTLAGREGAVLALVSTDCEAAGAAGADRLALLAIDAATTYDPDNKAAVVAAAIAALAPRHILFAESPDGGDLARRVAVLTDTGLFSDVEMVSATSLARPARGRRIEQRCAPTQLITLSFGAASPYADAPREARPQPFEANLHEAPEPAILNATFVPADPARIPLALADFVVSAGNGVTEFEMFHELVTALGATLGASRVLCDSGVMPREAQVGASGTVLAATCYLAFGIAGAPQHLQGVAGCEHVVAVNTDLHAAMIERAGLAIVQDAQLVMPALLDALRRERGGAP